MREKGSERLEEHGCSLHQGTVTVPLTWQWCSSASIDASTAGIMSALVRGRQSE